MRVLVTGATGFIGSHLTRTLVRHGYEVYALVRRGSDLWRIADVVPAIHVVRGDLESTDELVPFFEEARPRGCFHVGWYPALPGMYLMARENLQMLEGSLRLARHLVDAGCEVIVGVGTCIEYDTAAGHLSESTPVKPESPYAATKLALGVALTQWATVAGIRVVWARLFQEFGPFEDAGRLVPLVIRSLFADTPFRPRGGNLVRDYLPVEDVAEALRLLMESDVRGPVNVGSGMPISVLELAQQIGRLMGRDHLIESEGQGASGSAAGPAVLCADSRYLQAHTPWRPPVSLDAGLARTIDWWEKRTRSECARGRPR